MEVVDKNDLQNIKHEKKKDKSKFLKRDKVIRNEIKKRNKRHEKSNTPDKRDHSKERFSKKKSNEKFWEEKINK